ncbi:hypothetical protein [Rhodococcus ruber]|uniref:hypothetical protein n=1 Tax=Rhodococcus ruber TaxID=1830 RepID=UPI00315DB7E9
MNVDPEFVHLTEALFRQVDQSGLNVVDPLAVAWCQVAERVRFLPEVGKPERFLQRDATHGVLLFLR